MRRYLIPALIVANCLLVIAGSVSSLVSFPRLPETIFLWIGFFQQPPLRVDKSALFFLYPGAQVLFTILFGLSVRFTRIPDHIQTPMLRQKIRQLWAEEAWTAMIFINLILIHIQRSLIFISHGLEDGLQPTYFVAVFAFILLLIPAYRWQTRWLISTLS